MSVSREREQTVLSCREQREYYGAIAAKAENRERIAAAERELRERAAAAGFCWVVLDDDPTGVQTVHDLPVYTEWSADALRRAFSERLPMFYVLTNSRGLTETETTALHRELVENLCTAAEETGTAFQIISRSDSTLRGHFPLETELIGAGLEERLGTPQDGIILAPFFLAGGRVTIEDVHYVLRGDELIPAAQTEFARDASFGYSHSFLPDYVEEKTGGKVPAQEVLSIPLKLLRRGDADGAEERLLHARDGRVIVVNALELSDLRVFAAALYRCIAKGRHFLFRTAADFVRSVGAVPDIPLLTAKEMCAESPSGHGGVIVAGSHTEKTTRQLERLRGLPGLDFIEFDSDLVVSGGLAEEAARVRSLAEGDVKRGITPVVYTKRKRLELPGDTAERALRRSALISEALVSVIGEMEETPAYVIAKGGITSSDVGTKALRVKRAWVLGQVQPGIPVWRCGGESRFPGIPYVIFPGNVGEEDSLCRVVETLSAR